MGTKEGLQKLTEEFDAMEKQSVRVLYCNHQNEVAIRNICPIQFYWGSTTFYPAEQWLLRCDDMDKCIERTFALKNILAWGDDAIAAYQALSSIIPFTSSEMIFADGREPTTNERHLFNLLTWREHEARELKREVDRLKQIIANMEEDL